MRPSVPMSLNATAVMAAMLVTWFVSPLLHTQEIVAEDNAANYTDATFNNLENLGSGFGNWYRMIDGTDAIVRLQSAADNGVNSAVIDTDGKSFALVSSVGSATDQRVELGREFGRVLEDGETFSFDLAWNWSTPGLTGFIFYNGSWDAADQVIVFDFDNEGFFLNGELVEDPATAADWDEGDQWRQGGEAIHFKFTRHGDSIEYSFVAYTERSNVDASGVVANVNFDRIKFFNDGRPNWGENNPGQGSLFVNSFRITSGEPTSVKDEPVATDYRLYQNYPNPFNPTTYISYNIPVQDHVFLSVYNMIGQEIAVLVDEMQSAGQYTVQFNASHLPSGIYLYRLQVGSFVRTKSLTFIK